MPNFLDRLNSKRETYFTYLLAYAMLVIITCLIQWSPPNYVTHGFVFFVWLIFYYRACAKLAVKEMKELAPKAVRYQQMDQITGLTYRCRHLIQNDKPYLSPNDYMSIDAIMKRANSLLATLGNNPDAFLTDANYLDDCLNRYDVLKDSIRQRKEELKARTTRKFGGEDVQELIRRCDAANVGFANANEKIQRRVLKPFAEDVFKQGLTTRTEADLIEAAVDYLKRRAASAA